MKDQNEQLERQLISVIRKEMEKLVEDGKRQVDIAELTKTSQGFVSNLMNNNIDGLNGIKLPKLVSVASRLGIKINLKTF